VIITVGIFGAFNITTMQPNLLSKATLPNRVGFTFLAVFPDGSTKQDQVFLREGYIHTCTYFKEMIGWYKIK
jgi:hypothetical protein